MAGAPPRVENAQALGNSHGHVLPDGSSVFPGICVKVKEFCLQILSLLLILGVPKGRGNVKPSAVELGRGRCGLSVEEPLGTGPLSLCSGNSET